jgi:hypothetical protein
MFAMIASENVPCLEDSTHSIVGYNPSKKLLPLADQNY